MGNSVFGKNVVLITGAFSGIGRELAYQLSDQGAWLSLATHDAERLASVATHCRERGGFVDRMAQKAIEEGR